MKYCAISAGALGLAASDLAKIEKALATDYPEGTHVIWLNGAACTGCTVSLANTINAFSIQGLIAPLDTIELALLGSPPGTVDIGPNGPLDMDFIETLSTAVGARAVNAAFDVLTSGEPFALCLEGAIQTEDDGRYCQIWRVNKKHSVLLTGSFVWASADREALKVPNNTSEPIKLVNAITLTDGLNNYIIELHAGSVLEVGSVLEADSWVEEQADRDALFNSDGYTFTPDNKVDNTPAPDLTTAITLTGRVELLMGTLWPGSKISSCSLVYDSADRIALGGIYAIAAPVSIEDRTILEDITLTGTVTIAAGSTLTAGTLLKIGTWVEDSGDRSWLQTFATPSAAFALDNKIIAADVTLTAALGPTAGRIEAVKGSVLNAFEVANANYIYNPADEDRSFSDEVLNFAISDNCKVVIAVGTCASFGGIPAANGSVTGARGLISTGAFNEGACEGTYCKANTEGYWDYLYRTTTITRAQWEALMCKTVCVPGCPPHPDWIVGTIAYWLQVKSTPKMDEFHRPLSYYGEYQCTNCIWRVNDSTQATVDIDGNAQVSKSGRTIGNSPKLYVYKYDSSYEGCLGILGCKGRETKADCSYRRWNGDGPAGTIAGVLAPGFVSQGKGGVSWCVLTRAGCHGCTEPRFPDGWGPFFMYK
jgi:Ni,Fe-hydrogenase I small subunit